jgi:hypothetical protein
VLADCNLYGCPCVPAEKVIKDCSPENLLPEYTVSGTHRQIGRQIGQILQQPIQTYIYSQTTYCVPTYESLGWINEINQTNTLYSQNFRRLKRVNKDNYPEYAQEIKGIAEGAQVPEDYIWALNFQDEEYVTDLGGQRVKSGNIEKADGCSNLFYQDADGNVLFGHNEDGDPTMAGPGVGMVILHVNVNDPEYGDLYNYTVGYYLGMLPGWSFGFNSYGIVFDMNSLYPLQLGRGLGTAFTSRDVFSAKNIDEAIAKAAPFGASLGISANIGSLDEGVWVNLEGTPDGAFKLKNHTALAAGSNYWFHHFNNYLTNKNVWYHESPSSAHREINLARLVNQLGGFPSSVSQMATVLGDTTDSGIVSTFDHKNLTFWRTGFPEDYATTHATVIANTNPDKSLTYRVWATGVNPKTCPNTHLTYTVRKLQ